MNHNKRLACLLALALAIACCIAPFVHAEPAISNEVKIQVPKADKPVKRDDASVPELSLLVSLLPDAVSAGGTMVCSVTIENTGGAIAGQEVFMQLPMGLTPMNPEMLPYDPLLNMIRWIIDLHHGETTTLAFDVTIPADAVDGMVYPFTATLGALTATASAIVIDSDLSLNMSTKIKRAEPGDAVHYTITASNAGLADAIGLTVTNQVPGGMLIDASSITQGGVYAGGQINWTIDLLAGEVKKLEFLGIVPDSAQEGDVFVNVATTAGMVASASITVIEPKPILTISKKVNNRTPEPDTTVKYTITVKNTGAGDAYDVHVIDDLPADMDIVKGSISHDGEYRSANHRVVWYVDVPAFDSVKLTVKAYVPDSADDGDVYTNRARIVDGDSARAKLTVTESDGDAVPKTGDASIIPAAWNASKPMLQVRPGESVTQAEIGDIPMPEMQEMFLPYHEQNQDVVGWLNVPNQVDMPIVQTTDNDYYMTRNFDRADDAAGTLFLDERNVQFPRDQHLLIYGHNMKSGTMFGRIQSYRLLEYLQANPLFTYQPIYDAEPTQYVVVAVLDASMDLGDKDYMKIRRPNFDDESEDWQSFLSDVQKFSYFDIPVELDETDPLITLVTCSYYQPNGRLLLIGRALREGETAQTITEQMAQTVKKA